VPSRTSLTSGRRSALRAGADVVVQVPRGTRVEDEQGLIADLVDEGTRAVVARGGRGGQGNVSLATSRDRVPRVAEAGEPGEERRLSVELRIVADVGLVGLPNAGKSTLLAALTAARPKVADYPFTTLSPNLGVAETDDRRFVVADVPGLIEGASQGRGLGHRFLRHVSRSRALVLVVDLSAAEPGSDLATLRGELEAYDLDLVRRSSIVVGTKLDLVPGTDSQALGAGAIGVSAVTGEGMPVLRERLATLAAEAEAAAEAQQDYVVLRPARPRFVIRREGERFRVVGRGVERWVAEADLEDPRRVAQLQKRLVKEGVERELLSAGAKRGDEVVIGSAAFEFLPGEEIADGAS
jgi:GTPase